MLDGPDAGSHSSLDPLSTVGVGGNVCSCLRSDLDHGLQLFLGHLGRTRAGAGSEHGSCRQDLDEVRSVAKYLAGVLAVLVDARRDAHAEVLGEHGIDVHSKPGYVAPSTGAAHEGSRHHHPGTFDEPSADRIAQGDVGERSPATGVAHCREAG